MGWFSKKRAAPSDATGLKSDRYRGRPLLILVENYVLHVIGHLPAEKVDVLEAAVRRVWGGGSDWCSTFRKTLDLNDSVDDTLRALWERNQVVARERGEVFTPEDFARGVADVNFAPNLARKE